MIHTLLDFTQLGPPLRRTTRRGISFLPTSLAAITRKRGRACAAPKVTSGRYVSLHAYNSHMGRNLIDQRYEVRTLVGSGGMADVYLAVDEVLGREVALKLLKDRYAENEEFVERFRREAKSAAALSSPYIVPIFDRGETDDGTYYITMEYLPGGTLKERITATGAALGPQAAAEVALQVAKALQTAHVRGVVHRDIKPRNILITDTGHVKVADFGIARAVEATTISQTGDILGSAKYMSPEQAEGDQVGPASDLYSLGVVLYEMLTGRVPFEVEIPDDVPIRHAVAPPRRPKEVNPEVPEELDAITMKLLSTRPEDRCESAEELIQELQRARADIPSAPNSSTNGTTAETVLGAPKASTPSPTSPAKPVSRRRRVLPTLTILAVLLTLLAAVGWSLWQDSGRSSILRDLMERLPTEAFQDAKRPPSAPEMVRVPTVKGMSERAARQRLTEAGFEVGVDRRESSEKDTGKVIGQSVPGGKEAKRGSKVLLTVGEGQQVTKVPDVTGLPYSEAEKRLEEAGYLLGGVEEATSQTVPAGVVMKQDPPPGTTLALGSYVYLTDSVGPPAEGTDETQSASSAASAQSVSSGEVSGKAAAVAAAVRGHYEAIGGGNFEEAYSYFGSTMRSETDEANWIAGEESSQIQSITINSLEVNEVSGSTATATVDFSSVNKAETARFHIVWMLVKEGGEWKLDHQLSGQRIG
jgi:eukaryotic-like serine/threonine-protein kinase